MSLDKNQQQEIKQAFQREIECARLLNQSLDLEYEALAERHVDALDEVVREKQERVHQLEMISGEREKLLESLVAMSATESSKKNNNYLFRDNKQLTDLWDELVDIAEKCRDKNRINGSIVEIVSKQSRHALDILHGILPDASQLSELYDNTGQAIKSANKRSLVQA